MAEEDVDNNDAGQFVDHFPIHYNLLPRHLHRKPIRRVFLKKKRIS